MPRDKTVNHEKIIAAAYDEFLRYGFKDASMRRIAAVCKMSASGLYKHFSSKEDMFAALVSPAYEGLKAEFNNRMKHEFDMINTATAENILGEGDEILWIVKYIYNNYKAFKLLVCRSQGTRYEGYVHDFALMEEEATAQYMRKLKELGTDVRVISDREFHLFVTTNIGAIFQVVEHDLSREEALVYAKHLDEYNTAGWRKLMRL